MDRQEPVAEVDLVVVGAGITGIYQLYRAREAGFSVLLLEAGGGVGGTWYWNRYPGARCDVESMQYSFSFSEELDQEWTWSEKYSPQPEILAYANHVADRFDLRRDITFDTRVTHATWREDHWEIRTDGGEELTARGVDTLIITGCSTSGCVRARCANRSRNALNARARWSRASR